MTEITEVVRCVGEVERIIDYDDGRQEIAFFKNTILSSGREALAAALTNDDDDVYSYYVSQMIFGDGGTTGGTTKFVNASRTGLFGITRANKPVIAIRDANVRTQANFTSVIAKSEANGYVLNEMALQMNNGDLYSMLTFPDMTKTSSMQITWIWRVAYL